MSEFKAGDRIRNINPHPILHEGKIVNSWDSHEFGFADKSTIPGDKWVYFLPDEHLRSPYVKRPCICAGRSAGGMLKKNYVLVSTADLPGFTFDE